MVRAITTRLGSLSSYRYGADTYDSTKLGLGLGMCQLNGATNENKWAGPIPVNILRPEEYGGTAISMGYPRIVQWSNSATSSIDWVFFCDPDFATGGSLRNIAFTTYNRLTQTFTLEGFVLITFPNGNFYELKGFEVTYDKHTAGTVAVSGTAVTGTSTTWQTDKACVGNRIGFGSSDPTQITQWYEITAIGSDTTITLNQSVTVTAGTAYVIEDLRFILIVPVPASATGGLMVVKGLRPEIFIPNVGTTIPFAATTDNARFNYWLADAAANTISNGTALALEAETTKSSQMAWGLDVTATLPTLYKWNVRASLTLTGGKDISAFQYKTAAGAALVGTIAPNGMCLAAPNHGQGSGVSGLYFATTTRIYRTNGIANILSGSTTFMTSGDSMVETPPGSGSTFALSALMNYIRYVPEIDRFTIATAPATTPFRSYLTKYSAPSGQFERIWGCDIRQIDQAAVDNTTSLVPSALGFYFPESLSGITYLATKGATAATNHLYAIPLMAGDWEYAAQSKERLLLPVMPVSNADKFICAYANGHQILGDHGNVNHNLGTATEAWRIYYRTSGISDDSGGWTLMDQTGSMSGVAAATGVQLMVEFRTLGYTCLPARISSVGVLYQDLTTDYHYQFSPTLSDITAKKFVWRFATPFRGTVPTLRVRLTDADSGSSYVDDNTGSPTGTFEQSTDGVSWSAWTNADVTNQTTYIRYTPVSLTDSVKVQALLTLN